MSKESLLLNQLSFLALGLQIQSLVLRTPYCSRLREQRGKGGGWENNHEKYL